MTPPSQTLTVQLAGPEDVPEIHAMLRALAGHRGERATISADDLRRLALQAPGARLLVARRNGRAAGYALLILRTDFITGRAVYEVDQIFVEPGQRRRGIGGALAEAALTLSDAEGRARVMLGGRTLALGPGGFDAARRAVA